MKNSLAFVLLVGLLASCASVQYWVHPNKNLQETAADLHACRLAAQPIGSKQVYSAAELEQPCMAAKGYVLSNKPATN
jgi:hypothetical protein